MLYDASFDVIWQINCFSNKGNEVVDPLIRARQTPI